MAHLCLGFSLDLLYTVHVNLLISLTYCALDKTTEFPPFQRIPNWKIQTNCHQMCFVVGFYRKQLRLARELPLIPSLFPLSCSVYFNLSLEKVKHTAKLIIVI